MIHKKDIISKEKQDSVKVIKKQDYTNGYCENFEQKNHKRNQKQCQDKGM